MSQNSQQHQQQSSLYNIPPPMQQTNLNYQAMSQNQQLLLQPPPSIMPPNDLEQKNIIEKLANFVSRNGPEFENVTKLKQNDNPKFSFLFGGEYFSYYQYRLNIERESFYHQNQQQQQQQPNSNQYSLMGIPQMNQSQLDLSVPPPMTQQSDPYMSQISAMQSKINEIKEQIYQSERNLKAQSDVSEVKKKIQIEELLISKKVEKFNSLLLESQLDINSLEQITNKIIESCTKEAIGNGRNFVFNKTLNNIQVEAICYFLMQKIINKESTDDARLHLIYFINDIIHNANRKNIEIIKRNLEKIIIPCFCYAINKTDDEKRSKMNKLLELWEKNKYYSTTVIEKLKNPNKGVQFHEDMVNEENDESIKSLENEIEKQLKQYERQHKEYADHSVSVINNLEMQINHLLQQQQQQQQQMKKQSQINMMIPPPSLMHNQFNNQQMSSPNIGQHAQLVFSNSIPPPQLTPQQMNGNNTSSNKFSSPNNQAKNPPALMSLMSLNPYGASNANQNQQIPLATPLMSIPPPTIIHQEVSQSLDLSRPPPGFGPMVPNKSDTPLGEIEVPYYNLPAGLILKEIKNEDINYKPLDPKMIKLPAPEPPTEKLIKAIEEFYLPASPTKPRNADGWEKNGLYDFYKMKLKTYIQKKTDKENKKKERKKSSRKRSRERSRSRSKRDHNRRNRRSYSTSSRSSSSRSSRSRSRSRSRSKSRTRSYSPVKQVNKQSPPRSIRRRSATPPHISLSAAMVTEQRIDYSNKGHQLLQKMGYSGGGLGRREQGIVNPIEASEARDKVDQYRGVGMRSDPFEAFRKNKAQGYIQRLRDRDDLRKEENLRKAQLNEDNS